MLCEGLFFCCVGVGVVGHRHRGHAVDMVSHRFQVMPWVWVYALVFMGLVMGFVWWVIGFVVMLWVWVAVGFIFCGCGLIFLGSGLIFLGSCELILVVVVVGCVKWWLISGYYCFFFFLDKCGCDCCVIKVDILFYCSVYIILMCCLCYFIVLKAKIKPLMLDVL